MNLYEIMGGYYNDEGHWIRLKYCFIYCGPTKCNCGPPDGKYYNPNYDLRLQKTRKKNA